LGGRFVSEVDVVIPCKAPAPWLRDAIRSVLLQDVDSAVFVVDDGSSDSSVRDCLLELSDSRLRYLRQEASGPSTARNRGVQAGESPWCFFLDADDLLSDGALDILLAAARAADGIAIGTWQDVDRDAATVIARHDVAEGRHGDGLELVCRLRPPAGSWLVPRTDILWDVSRRVWEVTRYLNRVAAKVGRVTTIGHTVCSMRQHDSASRLSHVERHFSFDVEAAFCTEEYAWLAQLGERGSGARRAVAERLLALLYAVVRQNPQDPWIAEVLRLARAEDWLAQLRPRFGSAAWCAMHFGRPGIRAFAGINSALGR
jgi:glycosyltransferase involved in cell wall biosynthesis